MNITDLRRMRADGARVQKDFLRPTQIEHRGDAKIRERLDSGRRQLRQVVRSQQRAPAGLTAVHRWITAQVASVQQSGEGKQSFWVVHHASGIYAVRQY